MLITKDQQRLHMQTKRKDIDYKDQERLHKRTKRKDDKYKDQERLHKRTKRKDINYKNMEKESKRVKRQDIGYKNLEDKNRKLRLCDTLQQSIEKFQHANKTGPIYICCCCNQLFFKEGVVKNSFTIGNSKVVDTCLSVSLTNDNSWLCITCNGSLRKDKIPKLSLKNGMGFPHKPQELELHKLEERLISLRIPFMQLRQLARGGQFSMRGNIVNVPVDVSPTVNALPRNLADTATVPIQLKKRLCYKSSDYVENVRPVAVVSGLHWLMENSELYKESKIEIDNSWLNRFEKGNEENKNLDVLENVDPKNAEMDTSDDVDLDLDDDDTFSEIDSSERIGINTDTLLEDIEPSVDNILTFAPGEGQRPLGLFQDSDAEYLSFPTIFCGQRRILNIDRSVSVHYSDICKYELRSADRRVANSVPNLFYKMKKIQIKQLSDKVFLPLRRCKTKGKNYKVRDVLDNSTVDNIVRLDEGYYILRTIRNSPPYLEKRKKDVFAMIRQLGIPTWFTSLSAADTRWKDLLAMLGKLLNGKDFSDADIDEMSWDERTRLVQSDPVTCARYFDHRVQTFINIVLKSTHNPLGKVTDFFYRVEFQNRGSPHIHMLIWVEDAPIYGKDNVESITQYIDNHVGCTVDVNDEAKEYVEMQKHKHSRTCRKHGRAECRFSFPQPPMSHTQLLLPLETAEVDDILEYEMKLLEIEHELDNLDNDEIMTYDNFLQKLDIPEEKYINIIRSTLKGPKVFMKRMPMEARVNPYMKNLLTAWKANHDLQFVLDAYACAMYIVAYISKSQKGMSALLDQACKEARQGNKDLRQQVRQIGNKFLNASETCAQEAAYLVLQLPVTRATRDVLFINTSSPDERTFLLKSKEMLEKLKDDSTDIGSNNLIKRYSCRPKLLENWCLADYASWLDIIYPKENEFDPYAENMDDSPIDADTLDICDRKDNEDVVNINLKNGIIIKQRKRQRVIRYVRYSEKIDKENACREKLLLYTPWRKEMIDLLAGCDSYTERYAQCKTEVECVMSKYDCNIKLIEQVEENIQNFDKPEEIDYEDIAPGNMQQECDDASLDQVESEQFAFFDPRRPENQCSYDIGPDIGLHGGNQNSEIEILAGRIPDFEYRELVRMLNKKQREFFTHVLQWIKLKDIPLHSFLTGGAGVGKSVVISTLYQALMRYLCSKEGDNPEDKRILLCAPTGKAAYNIQGSTIHSAFKIDPNKGFGYKKLSSDVVNSLRMKYRYLSVVIIDEISMVGNRLFNFISLRLQEIKGNTKPFGGVHMIVVGDLFQLQPVTDSWIFQDLNNDYGPLATNLWKEYFTVYILDEIMRQREDRSFADLLNRLRECTHTEEDIKLLRSRIVTPTSPNYPLLATHVYPTNILVTDFNDRIFEGCTTKKREIRAHDSVVSDIPRTVKQVILQALSQSKDPSKTGNLFTCLRVGEGLRYEMTNNIDVEDGLTNGSGCQLQCIQHLTDSAVPSILWVKFDHSAVGRKAKQKFKNFLTGNIDRDWTPIFAISRTFSYGKNHSIVARKQFPLRAAAGKTIHKCQGDTVREIVVHMGSRKVRHSHYVAMSRVTKISGLHILNLNEEKISVDDRVKEEMKRLQTQSLLELCFLPVYQIPGNKHKIIFQNARSFNLHYPDLKSDLNFTSADIITISETRLLATDMNENFALNNFYPIIRNDQVPTNPECRPSHGVAFYLRDNYAKLRDYHFSSKNVEYSLLECQDISMLCKPMTIIVLYRASTCKLLEFKQICEDIQRSINYSYHTVIIGDFNDISNVTLSSLQQLWKFDQLVTDFTTDNNTTIDLCFGDRSTVTLSVIECSWSDHKTLVASVSKD